MRQPGGQRRRPRRAPRSAALGSLLALSVAGAPAPAADPQPYTVSIGGTAIGALDTALHASSQLESLRKDRPVGPFALIGRAQQDEERLGTVLDSFGYYRHRISIRIEGHALDDPALADAVATLPAGRDARVEIAVDPGVLYRLRRISVDNEISPAARSAMGLESGAPAVASEVLAARERLRSALEEEGHALARVEEPQAYEDPVDPVLDVEFRIEAGPKAHIGAIGISGLMRLHEDFIRRRLLLHEGEPYSPSRIERARADLLALGVFSGVTVQLGKEVDAAGGLPVTFELRERKRHAVTLNAAYSSDLGGSFGATWSDRDLFGNGEQLNFTASAINLGGTATTGLGYNFAAQLIKPDFLVRDQSLQFSVAAIKQNLIAYQQTAYTGGVSLNRRISQAWSVSVGVNLEQEQILQEGDGCLPPAPAVIDCTKVSRSYTLVSVPVSGKYDSTGLANPLADPLHGMRAALTVTPTESFGPPNATFTVIQSTVSGYIDLERFGWSAPGRSVLALRALGGLAIGAGTLSLPPDQRFYGGGSLSVRGYPYQAVGPLFLDGNPVGGTAIDAVGAELRQRIGRNFGTVLFIDAGEVTSTTRPLQGTLSVGYGTGLRYYTPIGPIRLDVGFPGAHPAGPGFPFVEVYVGLGQVF